MTFARKILVPLLILTALLTACGSGLATSTPVDANSISTSLVGTLVASLFQTQTALVPPAVTSTPVPPPSPLSPLGTVVYPTVIFQTPTTIYYYPTLSTIIPSVTGTVYTPTVDPLSLASGCNNMAFVRDVTIPSGTVLNPKEDFVKTWKVANTGTCKWEYQYQIMLISGNGFNAKNGRLNRVVDVGNWAEISIGMGAPKNPGDYTSYWRLADQNGIQFGSTFVVSFTVSSPTSVPSTNTPVPTSTTASTSTPVPTDTPDPTP